MPHLTDHDLRQMDEAWLESLAEPVARAVLVRVVAEGSAGSPESEFGQQFATAG